MPHSIHGVTGLLQLKPCPGEDEDQVESKPATAEATVQGKTETEGVQEDARLKVSFAEEGSLDEAAEGDLEEAGAQDREDSRIGCAHTPRKSPASTPVLKERNERKPCNHCTDNPVCWCCAESVWQSRCLRLETSCACTTEGSKTSWLPRRQHRRQRSRRRKRRRRRREAGSSGGGRAQAASFATGGAPPPTRRP